MGEKYLDQFEDERGLARLVVYGEELHTMRMIDLLGNATNSAIRAQSSIKKKWFDNARSAICVHAVKPS
jgi:hypothetical protein